MAAKSSLQMAGPPKERSESLLLRFPRMQNLLIRPNRRSCCDVGRFKFTWFWSKSPPEYSISVMDEDTRPFAKSLEEPGLLAAILE